MHQHLNGKILNIIYYCLVKNNNQGGVGGVAKIGEAKISHACPGLVVLGKWGKYSTWCLEEPCKDVGTFILELGHLHGLKHINSKNENNQ